MISPSISSEELPPPYCVVVVSGSDEFLLHSIPENPLLQMHSHGLTQRPLTHPGYRTHSSQRGPFHPGRHQHSFGLVQNPVVLLQS